MAGATRPVAGARRPYRFPDTERHVLSNGLTVHVARLERLPVATALLMADAGGECDDVGGAGAAALTADALAEGTKRRDAVALTDAFERLGGELATGVTWTYAECSTTVLSPRLGDALQLLAEVASEPAFPESEVERLRQERLAELLQQRTEPRGLADDMFARFTFAPESRYACAEGGDEATVGGLTRASLAAHHARFIVPRRSRLIVTGDVDPGLVVQLAEQAFGGWQVEGGTAPEIVVGAAHAERGVHLVAKADAPQSELRIGHLSVPRTHPDFHALSVMNAILGGLFNSRINLNLRERNAYTYGAFTSFDWRRRASAFEASTAVRSDVTAAAVREILDEIDRIRAERVSASELSLAVDYLTGVFPIRFETTAAIADALAMREGFGLPDDYYDTYRERIAAVSADDVLRVAQAHLEPARLQVVAVGDAKGVRDSLAALGVGAVREYDALGRPSSE